MAGDKLRTLENDDAEDNDERDYYFTEERSYSSNNVTGNRFNYTRILGSMYDIRDKSNIKKLAFVIIVILTFVICIFVLRTLNNEQKPEKTFTTNINNSDELSTQHTNVSEIVVTQKSTINFENTTKIGARSNSSDKNLTELLIPTTQANLVTTQNSKVGDNVVTSDSGLAIITNNQMDNLKQCLDNFTKHQEDDEIVNQCYLEKGPVRVKTEIRFVMGDSLFFICLVHAQNCDPFFALDRRIHTIEHELKDTYFNYMIGVNGLFYQGRHLSCSFDEHFLPEDHTNILTVGIPDCRMLNLENQEEKNNFNKNLIQFLNCSERSGLLAQNYTMKYHMDCKNYLLTEKIFNLYHDKIILTEDDNLNFEAYFKFKRLK